jgi:NADPH:quinone reductase-like Zn-dependent oxidoreductase
MRSFSWDGTVKKIIIERPGGYNRLQIKEFPTPAPQNHEVLIEVSAAGVNFADVFIRRTCPILLRLHRSSV